MISIALPDSLFVDDKDDLRAKTTKAGTIARAASIFGVERIYIYRDSSGNFDSDYLVARSILEYAEMPQYLRRRLVRKHRDLQYVGLLPPLRIPHHMTATDAKSGELREAALVFQNGELRADVGTRELAKVETAARGQAGQRRTVQVTSTKPLTVKVVERPKDAYWGYEIRRAPSLARFLRSANFNLVVFTSRLGDRLWVGKWDDLRRRAKEAKTILLCYGSPEAGVESMLRQDQSRVEDFAEAMHLNFFPEQKVETIRLEEALIGILSILNVALNV